jgi:hypothetical protein
LEEYLLESGKGGSIAGVAYNPCGTDGGALVLNDEVLKNIFVRGERILGKAIFAAKCSVIAWYPTQDTLYGPAVLYTLFGDPALRLKAPQRTSVTEPGHVTQEPGTKNQEPITVFASSNPVTGTTTITYSLPKPGRITLRIYDVTGKLVATLADGFAKAGIHTTLLGAHDHAPLARGAYILQLTTGGGTAIRKLIVR